MACEKCGLTMCAKCASKDFDSYMNDLEEKEQPTCNIENPEDCEACGS